MSGIETLGLILGTFPLLISALEHYYTGERITKSRDIVASFTEFQAIYVFRIQSEIIKLSAEISSQQPSSEVPPPETTALLQSRLGDALQRYG